MKKIAQNVVNYGKQYGYDQDSDNDGIMDNSDPFPNDSSEWKDTDNDGIGNNSDDYPYDASNGKNASKENLFVKYKSTSFAKGTGEVPLTVLSATELFLNMVCVSYC